MERTEPLDAMIERGTPTGPVIVLLHGRGSDERDLLPIGRMLHPDATTVSVRAPFEAAPWGYGPGFAWYRFMGGTTPDADTFEAGQKALHRFIAGLPDQLGRPATPLILGGFSQGGTSSLAYLAQHPGSVAGVLVFSGFVADHPAVAVTERWAASAPIFWGHGTADTAVPYENAKAGWEALRGARAQLEDHTYPEMAHTISAAELDDARAWVHRVIGA